MFEKISLAGTSNAEWLRLRKTGIGVSDGELRETQTANYFSNIYPIDCAVLFVNA